MASCGVTNVSIRLPQFHPGARSREAAAAGQCEQPSQKTRSLQLAGGGIKPAQAYPAAEISSGDGVKSGGVIKYDLDWLVDNWESTSCDLWEEVESNNFFWNRFTMRKAMYLAASFAKRMGDKSTADIYAGVAGQMDGDVKAHFNGTHQHAFCSLCPSLSHSHVLCVQVLAATPYNQSRLLLSSFHLSTPFVSCASPPPPPIPPSEENNMSRITHVGNHHQNI
jgi:hypothetical protein